MILPDRKSHLFDFEHAYKNVSRLLRVRKNITRVAKTGTQSVEIEISELEGQLLGVINGRLKYPDKNCIFEATESYSLQQRTAEGYVNIPRVVGATIAQIVIRGVVDTWYSSSDLSFDGWKMYETYLHRQQGLLVVRPVYRYRITRSIVS
jgi:hypothetical protein